LLAAAVDGGMSDFAPDSTEEWALPERARPPLLGELVERIDEALATARASEAAVMTVGAAAFDAAEQARRAAELAERASAVIARNGSQAAAAPQRVEESTMGDFTARADRLAERLQRLQRMPLSV
jgi:hypothetical protein